MGFEPCLSALERPTRAVRSETIAVRSFTSSVKSVMGITSHQMEGSARHEGRQTATLQRKCMLFRTKQSLKKAAVELHIRLTRKERSMKSKRFVLNALLVVAILTLLVFSYSYMNQPRFGYALYAVFSGETTYNTIGFIDAIFFYVVGPVSSELIAFVVSYNLNQQSQTHSATSAKQGINLFVIMIILQIATVLIIALTATNVLKYEFGFIVSCLMATAAGIAVSYTTPAKK